MPTGPRSSRPPRFSTTIAIILTGVVYVLIAVGFVVLGVLVGKGKQPARVVTWVIAGLGVLCLGCGVVGSAISDSLSGMGGDAESQELIDRITAATPGWVNSSQRGAAAHRPDRHGDRDHSTGAARGERLLPQGAGSLGAADRLERGWLPPGATASRAARRRQLRQLRQRRLRSRRGDIAGFHP